MGLFDIIKNNYDKDDDLKDLDELLYEDESGLKNKRSINDMIKSFELGDKKHSKDSSLDDLMSQDKSAAPKKASQEGPSGLAEKTKQQQADVLKEEEKYDYLLNSIQAQSLIRTVDKVSLIKEKTPEQKNKVSEEKFIKPEAIKDTASDDEESYVDIKPAGFSGSEIGNFVKSQCDIMEEASRYIENAKVEYESVTDYYEDIQKIENAPDNIKQHLMYAADRVDNLSVDRRILNTPDNKLSNNAYRKMEAYEDEFPDAVIKLRKNEDEYNAIQRDIRMVKGERAMYRIEAKDLVKKQLRIKRYAQLVFALMVSVFVIFMLVLAASPNNDNISIFITVALLAAFMALGLLAYLKMTERKVYVTEIKLNKATALLNKVKIKYVNAANVLDYEYNKYSVKSAYELEQKYQAYVEMKNEQKKILEVTSNLSDAEAELTGVLKKLGVIDTHIWISQVKALLNPKEMVEVRHNLSIRRQKLRSQIEYNEGRIEDAKNNIKTVTKKNKAHAKEAMEVLEMYERRHNLM